MSLRAAMMWSVAVTCWGALAGAAEAQEFRSAPSSGTRIELAQPKDPRGMEASISVQGRFSILGGTVDPDIPAHYNDLFKSGLGVLVEGTLLWPVGPKWKVGPYLSLGWDGYDGKTDTDSFGDSLSADKMDMTTFLVGVRSVYDLGQHFSWDGHMGFGASHSSSVDGVLTVSGIPMDVRVFKSSTAFAWDLGTRFAYQAGPVVFDAGIGVRVQGAPSNADLDFNSGPIVAFEVEFGAGIRF